MTAQQPNTAKSLVFGIALLGFVLIELGNTAAASCATPVNAIEAENCLPGNPSTEWDVSGAGDASIQGFATDISVNKGQTVSFKIDTSATNYRLDIYRLGYYGGQGARKIASVNPTATLPQNQPSCLRDAGTGLVDCGNWAVSASWTVPASATSGIYFARAVRADTGGASHIVFIVRNDASTANLLFKTADTTWQAYNDYGGNSLYVGSPAGRAYKVSYNRPFNTRGNQFNRAWLFGAEYPMVRWLEANGYDLSYTTGVDVGRRNPLELRQHKIVLSVGHDEYWSAIERANIESARNAGVHLAFFSGNEVFWKTRWENSIDGSGTAYRTLVSYKETKDGAKIDPLASVWTGTWRDPRFSPPADGGRPENALTGTIFTVNCCQDALSINIPEKLGKHRFWRNTSVATLAAGQTASLPAGVLGYEWDEALDNGVSPAGLVKLSSTTVNLNGGLYLIDYGNTYSSGPATATHSLTLYRQASGALVFGAGTVRWPWGLDNRHDTDFAFPVASAMAPDTRMKQATVNLFADMGAQPASLQAGLVAASQSTDLTAPSSTITTPAAGATVPNGSSVTLSGTAVDNLGGGIVAGVEVSTDGGSTWHAAVGTSNWAYTWTPSQLGFVTLKSRAIDDSGNRETAGAGVTVTVSTRVCPCSLWPASTTPATLSVADSAVELGVKFKTDVAGTISGIRFYKGAGNTGTHIGKLYTSTGQLLASATFTNETATGWQQVNFAAPVTVSTNTVYVASYFAPNGGYSANGSYFNQGFDSAPLHALQDGVSGGNGVYQYGAAGGFPINTYNATNYWVDVVYSSSTAGTDTTPPTVTATTPTNAATGVSIATPITVNFSEVMTATSVSALTMELRNAANTLVPASVTYNTATNSATLTPNAVLAGGAVYTAKVIGGTSGVKDAAGNALATDYSWSFTTAISQICPCTIWPITSTPTLTSVTDTTAVELGVKFKVDVAGSITGIRFYKGSGNTGTHIGSLWSSTGALLATATFTGETDSGWQQVNFATPVAISSNTVYVASYFAPNGGYAFDSNYFAAQGVDNGQLHALQNEITSGNGVFIESPSGGFPSRTFNSANYWVDIVFDTNEVIDTTPPTVLSTTPTAGEGGIGVGSVVTVNFSEAMSVGSISNSTIELRSASNALISAGVTYNATTKTATLTPSTPLANGTVYSAKVFGGASGVKDAAGNALAADYGWTFTTVDSVVPPVCNGLTQEAETALIGGKFVKVNDLNASGGAYIHTSVGSGSGSVGSVNRATFCFTITQAGNYRLLGRVNGPSLSSDSFFVTVDGQPTTGYLWDLPAVGVSFIDAYVTNRGQTGPVQINLTAGQHSVEVYMRESGTRLDKLTIINTVSDTTPPTVLSTTPTAGEGGIGVGSVVTVNFSEAMSVGSISNSTIELRSASNALISAGVTYNATTKTATLTPSTPLANGTVYSAKVFGGASGVKDAAGNALAADYGWTFTTVDSVVPPVCNGLTQEAETALIGGKFVKVNDLNASGGAYIHTSVGSGSGSVGSVNRATFCFTITQAGNYRLLGRVNGPSLSSDSFFVTVDGQPTTGYLWDLPAVGVSFIDAYVTNRGQTGPVQINLTAGQHSVEVYMRESGTRLDKLTMVIVTL